MDQPEHLPTGPLIFAPQNELGVVFLFSFLAKRWRLRVEKIQAAYPDCVAYQRAGGREQRIRIEFEFKSRNFRAQGHRAASCDWLVCWEDNWPDPPRGLEIVELRREFGLGFNVWIVPMDAWRADDLDRGTGHDLWSAPSQAHKGDVLLMYLRKPRMCLSHVYVMKERAIRRRHAGWKRGSDYMARIRKVASLKGPVFFEDLRGDRILSTAHFVRSQMQGRPNATEYWPYLYRMVLRRNADLKATLAAFAPERLR